MSDQPSKFKWNVHFIVAVVVLAVSAVGLNAAVQMLQIHFKKVPIPLAYRLDDPKHGLTQRIGPWQMVSLDAPLDADLEANLGTKSYVFRDYVDTRLISDVELARFKDKSPNERKALLYQIQTQKPEAVMNIAVTYYTGMIDTVTHVPDICYVADGYQPVNPMNDMWDIKSPLLDGGRLPVRFIDFEDQTGARQFKRNVAYFFQTQGRYECVPYNVRLELQKLSQRENYYAKVELMTLVKDREQSIKLMKAFLNEALPEVERCLPDYRKLKASQQTSSTATTSVRKDGMATSVSTH